MKTFITYLYPVTLDQSVMVKLLFYTSTRNFPTPFNPVLTVESLPTSAVSDTKGQGVQPCHVVMAGRNVLLEFPSIPGRWYRVRYSPDQLHGDSPGT